MPREQGGLYHLVAAYFELGDVPSGVLMRRSLNMPELRLVCRIIVVDIQRKLDYEIMINPEINGDTDRPTLQELVPLVPVHFGVEPEERA